MPEGKKRGRERIYPAIWADLLDKHNSDKQAANKEYHKILVLAKEQGLGADSQLDDVRQPSEPKRRGRPPSASKPRRGRPPKHVTEARPAAAAAAAAAGDTDDAADSEDEQEEDGDGGGSDEQGNEQELDLGRGKRVRGRLQAGVLAAAAAAHPGPSDDDAAPRQQRRSAANNRPKPRAAATAAASRKPRSSSGAMADDKERLYQQLLKAKEGEVEANRRRADDVYNLAMVFAQGKGKLPAQSGDAADLEEGAGGRRQQIEQLETQLQQRQLALAAREAALEAKEAQAAEAARGSRQAATEAQDDEVEKEQGDAAASGW